MKVGELSKFTVSAEYAYGKDGLQGVVTPDSTVIIEAELLAILEKFESTEAAISRANEINDAANAAFRSGDYLSSITLYDNELDCVDGLKEPEAVDILKRTHRNISTAYAKTNNWKQSLTHASIVLEHDGTDLKAMVRRIEALINLHMLHDAREAIGNATRKHGNQSILRTLKKALEAAEDTEKKEETERFTKMFRK